MDYHSIIATRRKKIGVSQDELADVCNISCSYLKLIEQGKANPTIEILWKILDALGFELKVYDKFTQKKVL
ncbi:MAG: helix-turn-helix transcriptional regulator [Bacteroidales bacterium]|nr:helix-turn-helix transcriptional regulator [Bacteroidales bacterium]